MLTEAFDNVFSFALNPNNGISLRQITDTTNQLMRCHLNLGNSTETGAQTMEKTETLKGDVYLCKKHSFM